MDTFKTINIIDTIEIFLKFVLNFNFNSKLQNISNVRSLKNFFLYRLAENSILGKNPENLIHVINIQQVNRKFDYRPLTCFLTNQYIHIYVLTEL